MAGCFAAVTFVSVTAWKWRGRRRGSRGSVWVASSNKQRVLRGVECKVLGGGARRAQAKRDMTVEGTDG